MARIFVTLEFSSDDAAAAMAAFDEAAARAEDTACTERAADRFDRATALRINAARLRAMARELRGKVSP